jgi:serine/threonine protein phosphatase PrpC
LIEEGRSYCNFPSCEQGDSIMLTQHKNDLPATSHHTPVQTLEGVKKPVDVRSPALALRIGSCLDPGLERRFKPNEDTLFISQGTIPSASFPPKPFALFLVADGMGGQEHGQEASQLAAQSLIASVSGALRSQQMMSETLLPLLVAGVQYANRMVYQRNQAQHTRMGTTMTVALVIDTTAYVAHVGDSRLYLSRQPRGLSQITHDHSLVAALVDAGVIQPEDIYTHPMRNQIYRCLGEKPEVEVDTFPVPLVAGDILLVCSDGLWEMVRDQQIATILATPAPDPSSTASALIQAALAGGGADNIGAIVVQVSKREE